MINECSLINGQILFIITLLDTVYNLSKKGELSYYRKVGFINYYCI